MNEKKITSIYQEKKICKNKQTKQHLKFWLWSKLTLVTLCFFKIQQKNKFKIFLRKALLLLPLESEEWTMCLGWNVVSYWVQLMRWSKESIWNGTKTKPINIFAKWCEMRFIRRFATTSISPFQFILHGHSPTTRFCKRMSERTSKRTNE